MSGLQAITFARHGNKKWLRFYNYNFASTDTVAGLIAQELAPAMMSTAIAFIRGQEGYSPVAVLNLVNGKNLYVGHDGRWLANHVPLVYLNYPFRLGKNSNNEHVLCINEDSGLVTDDAHGEPFYVSQGVPMEQLKSIMNSLLQVEQGNEKTREICKILAKHGLIVPWEIPQPAGVESKIISGLYRIDELKLNALDASALIELRNTGALVLAYSQLFSMQHLRTLTKMVVDSSATAQNGMANNLGFTISDDSGTLNFDNLR